MKREAKTKHQEVLTGGDATGVRFSSPTIIARLGRREMTTADYREHRMGRREITGDQGRGMKQARTHSHKQTRVY